MLKVIEINYYEDRNVNLDIQWLLVDKNSFSGEVRVENRLE